MPLDAFVTVLPTAVTWSMRMTVSESQPLPMTAIAPLSALLPEKVLLLTFIKLFIQIAPPWPFALLPTIVLLRTSRPEVVQIAPPWLAALLLMNLLLSTSIGLPPSEEIAPPTLGAELLSNRLRLTTSLTAPALKMAPPSGPELSRNMLSTIVIFVAWLTAMALSPKSSKTLLLIKISPLKYEIAELVNPPPRKTVSFTVSSRSVPPFNTLLFPELLMARPLPSRRTLWRISLVRLPGLFIAISLDTVISAVKTMTSSSLAPLASPAVQLLPLGTVLVNAAENACASVQPVSTRMVAACTAVPDEKKSKARRTPMRLS